MPVPVIDLHEDVTTYYLLHGAGQPLGPLDIDLSGREADIPKWSRGGVRLVFASIFPGTPTLVKRGERYGTGFIMRRSPESLFEHFRLTHLLAGQHGIRVVESWRDAEGVIGSGGLGFLVHIEGADAIEYPDDLRLLHRLGLRSLGLTWNYGNRWAASCYSRKDYGLTADGEELVMEANELGIIIDLAHASPKAALEAAEVSRKPVIVSHTGVKAVMDHPRNVGDEVIEAVRRSGGVVGVSVAVSPFVGEDIKDAAKHLAYLIDHFGADVPAIGTDFHGLLGLPQVRGLETVDKLPKLLGLLAEMGYSDSVIEAVAYRNALRVLKQVLG